MTINIRATVHAYCFNTAEPDEREAYRALCSDLKDKGLKCFESHGGELHLTTGRKLDGRTVELETRHIYDNQWNTAPIEGVSDNGLRVMDWAQDYQPFGSNSRKQGYWIEPTPEMAELRRNTMACGYCGKQEPAPKGNIFCPHCLGSEYLEAGNLKLLRMQSVEDNGSRGELTDAEKAHLLPLWRTAQIRGNTTRDKARIEAAIKTAKDKAARAIQAAETERDGLLWLLDNGINTHNVIFYSHTGCFCFGWRAPVGVEVECQLLEAIRDFTWTYEVKCADGRVISGN